jgi:hypothetical protein
MNLLDRYMQEVRNHLPRKMQADLEIEIRSLIEDTLEDRSQAAGREINEDLMVEVLQEFGTPEKVAAGYLPDKYLIGPRLYPSFTLSLRIALTVIVILTLVGLGINLSHTDGSLQSIGQALLQGIGGLYSAALQVLGIIVFIFAIIQWAQPNISEKPMEWNPRKLKDVTPSNIVRPAKPITTIVIMIAIFALVNFYPHLIGIYSNINGEWLFSPVLSDAFFRFVPFINAILVVKVFENLILLRQGQWQVYTRLLSILGSVLGITLLFLLLTGSQLVVFSGQTNAVFGWTTEAGESLEQVLNTLLRLGLGIALVFEGVDLVTNVYRLVKRSEPVPQFKA